MKLLFLEYEALLLVKSNEKYYFVGASKSRALMALTLDRPCPPY